MIGADGTVSLALLLEKHGGFPGMLGVCRGGPGRKASHATPLSFPLSLYSLHKHSPELSLGGLDRLWTPI